MAYKVLEKKMSATGKRVDFKILIKPGLFQKAFEPYEIKGYIVSKEVFDEGTSLMLIDELMKARSKWTDCKKKMCTQSYNFKMLPQANAYVTGVDSNAPKPVEP